MEAARSAMDAARNAIDALRADCPLHHDVPMQGRKSLGQASTSGKRRRGRLASVATAGVTEGLTKQGGTRRTCAACKQM